MERVMTGEKEYEKLINLGNVDEKILKHPSFREAFIGVFVHSIGYDNYRVEVKNDAVIVEKTSNFPDATNGIYHGYRDAVRCVFKMELDSGREFLTVKEECVSIYSFDNRSTDDLGYHSKISAYDDRGYEFGFADFYRHENVNKNYPALAGIYVPERFGSGRRENPELNVRTAISGHVEVPYYADMYEWRVYTARRNGDGVAYKSFIEHINQTTENHMYTYGSIHLEHPERLAGNTTDFAVDHRNHGFSSIWKTPDGIKLSDLEVQNMIQEYNQYFVDSLSRGRR